MSNIRGLSDLNKKGGGGGAPGGGGFPGGAPGPSGGGAPGGGAGMPGMGGIGNFFSSMFGGAGAPQGGAGGEQHGKVVFIHSDSGLNTELRKAGSKLVRKRVVYTTSDLISLLFRLSSTSPLPGGKRNLHFVLFILLPFPSFLFFCFLLLCSSLSLSVVLVK